MVTETMVYEVLNFYDLKNNSWSGALQTLEAIEEKGLEGEFVDYINTIIGEGITDTQLNDYIWFETEDIENALDTELWGEN